MQKKAAFFPRKPEQEAMGGLPLQSRRVCLLRTERPGNVLHQKPVTQVFYALSARLQLPISKYTHFECEKIQPSPALLH